MLIAAAAILFVVGVLIAFSAVFALLRLRLFRFTFRALLALLFLGVGSALGIVGLGAQGLHLLDREATAARIRVVPTGKQTYDATVTFADGRTQTYALAGDDIVVDAHVVKWTPLASRLGLATAYRLERIAGRYRSVDQETTARRTVFPLSASGPVDLIDLAHKLPLAPIFDAEYGSATYVPVVQPETLEVKVSESGLLMRRAPAVVTP